MQLYAGSTAEFLTDAIQHRVAEKLGESYYQYFRFRASASEFASWQNSLTALTAQLQYTGLRDHGIALEMQLPLTSARLDAMLTGHDAAGIERAVIIELKQWTNVEPTEIDDCVLTFLGGTLRELPHPSVQVGNYRQYLCDTNSAFYDGGAPVELEACSWLHNLGSAGREYLVSAAFSDAIAAAPLFTGHDADAFRDFLNRRLEGGNGMPVLERVTTGRYAPSKKLPRVYRARDRRRTDVHAARRADRRLQHGPNAGPERNACEERACGGRRQRWPRNGEVGARLKRYGGTSEGREERSTRHGLESVHREPAQGSRSTCPAAPSVL